jgi:predicted Zn-dependent peptidase
MTSRKKSGSGTLTHPLQSKWDQFSLPNGMTAVHCPLPGDNRAYAGLVIRTGSRNEHLAQLGVSHFLEHMMFRGSKAHPSFRQLAEAFEWLGGEWNAATGAEHTEYWYAGTISNLEPALAALAEFMENPALLDMEIERQVILQELQGELNEFGNSTDLSFHTACHMWRTARLPGLS